MLKMEKFLYLTYKFNCLIIQLCANKWLMFNWIASDT